MNLLSLLAGLTKSDPHATVAIDADPAQPVHVSRSELWRRALQLRADLATAGVGRGDAVALWLPNWSVVLDWHIATASLGAHTVGLDLAATPETVASVLERAKPKVIALAHAPSAPVARDLPSPVRTLRAALDSLDSGAATTGPVPAVAVVTGPHDIPPVDPGNSDVGGGAWLPSTTTVGMPMPVTRGDELAVAFGSRLAAHRESAIIRHASAVAGAIGIGADDTVACALPLTGAFGFVLGFAALSAGATCLLQPSPTAESVLDDVTRFGVTHLGAEAGFAAALGVSWRRRPRPLPCLRWLGLSSEPGDSDERARHVADWAEDELRVTCVGGYGSAEVLALSAIQPPGSPRRWSQGGLPVSPGIEARVVDPGSGQPLSPGERGELQVRGYPVVEAYLGDEEATSARLAGGGWFPTGNLAVLSAEGELRRLGRIPAPHRD
ncbi:AMP-binding protein [Saccharomonospora sp. NPDC006951]